MDFVSFDDVVVKKSSGRGRAKNVTLVSMGQVYYKDRENPSRITTIRLSEDAMNRARFKIGDRVDLAFSKDGRTMRFRAIQGESKGYKISGATKTAKIGVVRATWYPGLPLLGDNERIIRAKCFSLDDKVNITVGEMIIPFGEIEILDKID